MPTKFIHYHGNVDIGEKIRYADPHMHTNFSDGALRPEDIVEQALEKGLGTVVVTDHDMIKPAQIALEYSLKYGYQRVLTVLVGSEISSRNGHILGIGLTEDIVPGLSMKQTIAAIHKQGGIAIIPHPDLPYVSAHSLHKTIASMCEEDPQTRADGYEVLNAGTQSIHGSKISHFLYGRNSDEVSRRYHVQNPIGAAIGSTDGHGRHVGLGVTGYIGDFIETVRSGNTNVAYESSLENIAVTEIRDMLFAPPKYFFGKIKKVFERKAKSKRHAVS
jgi:histidinol phosphatase-like PHP family hydrolase